MFEKEEKGEVMENDLIQEIVSFVKEAAPVMWQAAYRQSYVDAITNLIVIIGLIALIIYFVKWYKHFSIISNHLRNLSLKTDDRWNRHSCKSDKENVDIARMIFAFMTILATALAIVLFNGTISRIINPDYYAIQNLINLIPK